MKKRKVGILGGTFDPIHNAHLRLAGLALTHFHLDEVMFMPTGNSYLKTRDHAVTDAVHRCMMVKLAIMDQPQFTFSDLEVKRGGDTYTSETLEILAAEHPEVEYHFILGADSLAYMENWYHPESIFNNAIITVANRNHQIPEDQLIKAIVHLTDRFHARIEVLALESMDVSSTVIRNQVETGQNSDLIPPRVLDYIRSYGLYRDQNAAEYEDWEENE